MNTLRYSSAFIVNSLDNDETGIPNIIRFEYLINCYSDLNRAYINITHYTKVNVVVLAEIKISSRGAYQIDNI